MRADKRRITRRQHLSLLGGLGLSVLGFPFCACSQGTAPQKVRLWHVWDYARYPAMRDILEHFRRQNPGILLEDDVQPSPFLKAKLASAVAANALPDVLMLNSGWLESLQAETQFADLSLLSRNAGIELDQRLRPIDLERCRREDRLWCLPATSAHGTSMLFINEVLREQAGMPSGSRQVNWAEFTKYSAELVRRLNRTKELEVIALDPFFSPGLQIQSSLAAGLGSMPVSPDGRTAQLSSPESLRVAKVLDDYVEDVYGAFGGYRGLLTWRMRYMAKNRVSNFIAIPFERQAFAIAATGAMASYRKFMNPLRLSIQPVPGLLGLHGGVATHTWAYALNRQSKNLDAAWQLIRHLTLEEAGAGQFCRSFFRASPLRSFDERVYAEQLGVIWQGAREAISLDRPYPVSSMDELLRDLYYSVPMRRLNGQSVEDIMSLFNRSLQAYIDGDLSRVL